MKYLDRKTAAQYVRNIGVPMTTQRLADLASDEAGPRYVIINGRALYTAVDLDLWITQQASRPVRRRGRKVAVA